jgi:hypothetical protein
MTDTVYEIPVVRIDGQPTTPTAFRGVSWDGRVVERFAPDVVANDPRLLAAIDRELAVH